MTEIEIKNCWYYFRSLSNQLAQTEQFVDHSLNEKGEFSNGNTFSNEFAKILMLNASEFEVISKILCLESGIKIPKNANITRITKNILNKYPNIGKTVISTPYTSITPLSNWKIIQKTNKKGKVEDIISGIPWWNEHNLIKHNRNENFKSANLENCIYSLASLMVLELYLSQTVLGNINKIKIINCNYFDCEYGLQSFMVNPGRRLPDF